MSGRQGGKKRKWRRQKQLLWRKLGLDKLFELFSTPKPPSVNLTWGQQQARRTARLHANRAEVRVRRAREKAK